MSLIKAPGGLNFNIFLLISIFLPFLLSAQENENADSLALLNELQQVLNSQEAGITRPDPQRNNAMNPNISLIGDFQGLYKSRAERSLDAWLNEVEIAAFSTIDPYARADFYFSFHHDEESGEFVAGLEEGYLTTLSLPAQLQLKIGKFRGNFGKINLFHPHARNFIDNPAVMENYFGESLTDEGLSLSWLIPNPLDFYQDITVQVTRGPQENNSFTASSKDRFLYLAHLKNFWDISDNSTLELGFSGATGVNDSSLTSNLGGINLTYKWKPLQYNTYHSFEFQMEWLWSDKEIIPGQNVKTMGTYAYATYQLDKRLFLTGRFDYSNLPDSEDWIERSWSATLGWFATEFQKVELQYKHSTSNGFDPLNQVLLRSVFVIGSHGAHQY